MCLPIAGQTARETAAIPKAFLSILESKRVNQTSKESVKYTVSVVLIMHVLYMGQRLLKIAWCHFSSLEKPLDKSIWLNNQVEADTFMSFPYGYRQQVAFSQEQHLEYANEQIQSSNWSRAIFNDMQ